MLGETFPLPRGDRAGEGGAQIREIKNAFGEEGNKRPPLPFNWDGEEKKGNGTQHVSDDSGVYMCVFV